MFVFLRQGSSVAQAGLSLNPAASVSRVVGLQVCCLTDNSYNLKKNFSGDFFFFSFFKL
jgi:hypothetical protein